MTVKKLLAIHQSGAGHWVGDGFPVRTIFSHQFGPSVTPFLLLDYAGPYQFPPSEHPRGVEQHPHKGFETVTIVYSGEIEHRDSTGGGGLIGPGDVQWMTAASGLLHEEMHGRAFTRRGGGLEMIQLWVNLPATDKKARPHYQALTAAQIPRVALPDDAGTLRIIAGSFKEARGATNTYTPINLWDIHLNAGKSVELPAPDGHNTLVFVRRGHIEIAENELVSETGLAVFGQAGSSIVLKTDEPADLLVLDGQPINEPIAAQGPFVMNTNAELQQAFQDYRAGRMGQLR